MLQSALTDTCPDLVLPARCLVRTQDVQCAVIHSLSEILPVYEVQTIMQDIGY